MEIFFKMKNYLINKDCEEVLPKLKEGSIDLIFIDPPYNTGKTKKNKGKLFNDSFPNYLDFIVPKLKESHRILSEKGSLFVMLDWREVHYVKVELDKIFGRDNFINEIIWSFDFGGRSKSYWPRKHNTILWYAKTKGNYIFNYDKIDRIPYQAPKLCGPEKAALGKTPTTVWQQTIVHTSGHERLNYPAQKPLAIIQRIVNVHSNEDSVVLDFFAGSGTTAEAASIAGRNWIAIEKNIDAVKIIQKRLEKYEFISKKV
jgi:site-specific DNA-methyltransferase (adenine-specific)